MYGVKHLWATISLVTICSLTNICAGAEPSDPLSALDSYLDSVRDVDAHALKECIAQNADVGPVVDAYIRKVIAFRQLANMVESKFPAQPDRMPRELLGFTNEAIKGVRSQIDLHALVVEGDNARLPTGPITMKFIRTQNKWQIDPTSFFHVKAITKGWIEKRKTHELGMARAAESVSQAVLQGRYQSLEELTSTFDGLVNQVIGTDRGGAPPASAPTTAPVSVSR
jgi:hypothetical protein